MKTLYPGDVHADVVVLRNLLFGCGHWMPTPFDGQETYDPDLEKVVRAFQEDERLVKDSIVGPKTWTALQAQTEQLPLSSYPECIRDLRMSTSVDLVVNADGGQGLRYGRLASTKSIEDERYGRRLAYIAPLVTITDPKIHKPAHGTTCGLWAHQFLSCHLAAIFAEKKIYPTWPTSQSGRWIWTIPVAGEYWEHYWTTNAEGEPVMKWRRCSSDNPHAQLLRGYADYVRKNVKCPKAPKHLAQLYSIEDSTHFCLIEYSSHVGAAIRADENLKIVDPRTGLPARPGWYEAAANGDSDAEMERFTFRRISEIYFPPYVACRWFWAVFMEDVTPCGSLASGPLAWSTGTKYSMEVE